MGFIYTKLQCGRIANRKEHITNWLLSFFHTFLGAPGITYSDIVAPLELRLVSPTNRNE